MNISLWHTFLLSLLDTIYHTPTCFYFQQLKCEPFLTFFTFSCNICVWVRPKSIIQHVAQVHYGVHILNSDLQACWLRMFIPASNLLQGQQILLYDPGNELSKVRLYVCCSPVCRFSLFKSFCNVTLIQVRGEHMQYLTEEELKSFNHGLLEM